MKRISISEKEFQAVMNEILANIKADSRGDVILLLMTEAFGRMVKCKLFDGRFKFVSEDANMGEEEYKPRFKRWLKSLCVKR